MLSPSQFGAYTAQKPSATREYPSYEDWTYPSDRRWPDRMSAQSKVNTSKDDTRHYSRRSPGSLN